MKKIIHQEENLEVLTKILLENKSENLVDDLYQELIIYSDYKNVEEWNKAVKICECLTILGWGNFEPVQAICGTFFNGNPVTGFYNKFSKQRFVDAIWSKRKKGFTMEKSRTSYFESPNIKNKPTLLHNYSVKEDIQDLKLNNQRNWIPKNPIQISRYINNCYENSLKLAEDIEKELKKILDTKMNPKNYGFAVNQLRIYLSFSEATHHKIGNYTTFTQTNYIIADESLKLKKKDFNSELKKNLVKRISIKIVIIYEIDLKLVLLGVIQVNKQCTFT
ncbi:hypothetical protein PG910_07315 [Tenacibaculum dicentrarchi]|nr:hypothetical protein PG910_07315 [Tenacibaculum dicentrarchi]